ncbi:MAG: GNAT family N-acetyltransferase [Bdellovibrionota bacterium]|nr:GNAT family N-acetyltransferase [Pseudobdellovibrionaceae bacterium]|tara:strand:+ start:38126 stop:38653 length:528 start_codon:yes stop_codon:yes gene_type:complete
MDLVIKELGIEDKNSFLEAIQQVWEPDFITAFYFKDLAKSNYENYLEILKHAKSGINIPKEHVPSTNLFAFNPSTKMIGRVSIRHELNDFLQEIGGHIGYVVDPNYRNQGVATKLLKAALDYSKKNLGLKKVLLTCDEDNLASEKVIVNNGGIFENLREACAISPTRKKRFWINL